MQNYFLFFFNFVVYECVALYTYQNVLVNQLLCDMKIAKSMYRLFFSCSLNVHLRLFKASNFFCECSQMKYFLAFCSDVLNYGVENMISRTLLRNYYRKIQ